MSRRRLIDRIDDWLNPIVVKELRQAVQSKLVVSALLLFLFLQIFILGTVLLSSSANSYEGELDLNRGRELFQVLQGIMLGTCMLVPAYIGGRLGAERSDTHTDLLFISALKPRSIVLGKFLSGVVLVLLIFSACTPFMTFTYLLRGIDIPTVIFLVSMDLVLALYGVAAMMFLAVIPAPRPIRGALGLGGFAGLVLLYSGGMALTSERLRYGLFGGMDSWQFWAPMLSMLLLMAVACGLLFTWSVAILSPASANKALAMRLYVAVIAVLTGAGAYLLSGAVQNFWPMAAWLGLMAVLCCVQLFISVNERDELGPRITRSIPHARLLRLPAFLLYSGAAGGVLFSVLLLLGCFAASFLVLELQGEEGMTAISRFTPGPVVPSLGGWQRAEELLDFIRFSTALGLYTYCFCMTAVFVRSVLFRGHVKPGFTWLVALLLVGLGSVMPRMVAYFLFRTEIGYREDDPALLTDPFTSIGITMENAWRNSDPFDFYALPFLLVWAIIATGLTLPWTLKQFIRFKPKKNGGAI